MPKISIVVAVSNNGVIGRDGDMPWKLSTDLKRFKSLTLGKPLVMGRKTFESFGSRPLPGRPHVIVSRHADIAMPSVETVRSLEAGLERAGQIAGDLGGDEICVIGGGEIYRQALPLADVLYVTHVETDIADGDTVFPAIDPSQFEKLHEEAVAAGERDSFATRYAIYRRKPAL
ncbi:diacylglycerol kinase [Agrobacterium vitis]|uniref:dihydrofolate reductase n=1 Tax=Agrobacterium vitis TaxID=373 RepID=UPI0012E7F1AD|nr:dihydrofolate reductase [Agrobacterium vitis]MVA79740.1 diacylglycerol kinase [Agrobacterium vitis]